MAYAVMSLMILLLTYKIKYRIMLLMGDILQILIFVIIGILLLWFGHFLFFGPMSPIYPYLPWSKKRPLSQGKPGDPQICPVCSSVMLKGDLVKTVAFPSGKFKSDRLMHIKGCYNCLEKDLPRKCPVCNLKMSPNDYLIARMFERANRKNHVHVLGCNKCRKS